MKEFRYKEIMLHFDYPNSENLAPGVCVGGVLPIVYSTNVVLCPDTHIVSR